MRSDVRFVMHPDDEAEFVAKVTSEPDVVFVKGPKWSQPRPQIANDTRSAGNYLMIWHPSETPELTGTHYRKEETEWWYCNNEFSTIQFIRSGFHSEEPFLLEGRIAVCITSKEMAFYDQPSAASIERRFKSLRRFIKKIYTNKTLIWQNLSCPRSKTNPGKPDPCVWIGPNALQWLNQMPRNRFVKDFPGGAATGYLLDLVE